MSFDAFCMSIREVCSKAQSTVEQGERWVASVLRVGFRLSEEDISEAMEMAGGNDHGVDALHVVEVKEGPSIIIVIQGKYGYHEGRDARPLAEFQKFIAALGDESISAPHIVRLRHLLKPSEDGAAPVLRYYFASLDDPTPSHLYELESIKAIGQNRQGSSFEAHLISLRWLYEQVDSFPNGSGESISVCTAATGTLLPEISSPNLRAKTFVGTINLVDLTEMLREYKRKSGSVERIYDSNIRKWLKVGRGSVNRGLFDTLKGEPELFGAYNNGITLVANRVDFSDGRLTLDDPQVVNGCQTTRTLFEYMEQHYGDNRRLQGARKEPIGSGFLVAKAVETASLQSNVASNITRYSNRQNTVRGRDFLALESVFTSFRTELRDKGYYLEVQRGEFDALPKQERDKLNRADARIDAFDAMLIYAASVLGAPHLAFGRSIEFTPGQDLFEKCVEDMTAEDLLWAFLLGREAEDEFGYSAGRRRREALDEYKNQTRFFFAFTVWRFICHAAQVDSRKELRQEVYRAADRWRDSSWNDKPLFRRLLEVADRTVNRFFSRAQKKQWFSDRNSFLKSQDLISDQRFGDVAADWDADFKEEIQALRAALH